MGPNNKRIVFFAAYLFVAQGAHWTHKGEHGVDHWGEMFDTCAGSKQSPINLSSRHNNKLYAFDEHLTNDLEITQGQEVDSYSLINSGHSVGIDTTAAKLTVSGANLGKTYTSVGPHFHWAAKSCHGSEHTINGVHYPLEMHIVNYDAETYSSIGDAITSNKPGALAVVGVMFKVSDYDNAALNPIIDNLYKVRQPDKENAVSIPAFSLRSLLPADTREYFRYEGSLTTPTCNEVVTWTVFLQPQPVSERQLEAFRSLYADDQGTRLVDNWRPTQLLNGRTVYKSFKDPSIDLPTSFVPRKETPRVCGPLCKVKEMLCARQMELKTEEL